MEEEQKVQEILEQQIQSLESEVEVLKELHKYKDEAYFRLQIISELQGIKESLNKLVK